jgi:hypothetical protein
MGVFSFGHLPKVNDMTQRRGQVENKGKEFHDPTDNECELQSYRFT